MNFFSGNQKDDKVANLENEAQERIKRVAELRAQISNLKTEEAKAQSEYDAVNARVTALRKRKDELTQLKTEEATLLKDVKLKEEKQSALIAELERIQETRRQLTTQIAPLRSQVANEEVGAKKDMEEAARLGKILADNAARKKTIQTDTEFVKKAEEELQTMEKDYNEIVERIPLTRKKHEETKQLVTELEKNIKPINQSILDIWKKLPDDVLDQLVSPQMPRQN